MTQEDIIRMAREAGMAGFDGTVHAMFQLESFAALVAAAEFAKREWNFCERCGKRTADLTTIHTCTPPQPELDFKAVPKEDAPLVKWAKEQKPWVGLTNNELQPIADEYRLLFGSWVEDFARAIEQKLKEKNT